jgi:Gly-Xaa carboxypeptidase
MYRGYPCADTNSFWNLTGNIYRFTPAKLTENLNQHTVNEVSLRPQPPTGLRSHMQRISLNGHLTTTRFFYKLIQNADQREA